MKNSHIILICLISSFSLVTAFYFMRFFAADSDLNRDLKADEFFRATAACVTSLDTTQQSAVLDAAAVMNIPSLTDSGEPAADKTDTFVLRSGEDSLSVFIKPSPASSRPAASFTYPYLHGIKFGFTGDLFYTLRTFRGHEYLHNYRIKKGCIMTPQKENNNAP
ncbi:MAG: hypothetical protein JXR81_01075 [Candidatus Goldbacteria bacterium]|nr:hypothetical protein [Candidatus Goldiibacteriota bacterium]